MAARVEVLHNELHTSEQLPYDVWDNEREEWVASFYYRADAELFAAFVDFQKAG